MTPLPPVAGVIEVGLHWKIGEDANSQTKLHFQATGSPFVQADLITMATAIRIAATADLIPWANPAISLTEVTCTDLSTADQIQGLDGTVVPGTSTGRMLPAQVCALVNYKIARRYRGGKPRSYFPFGSQDGLQDPQTWSGVTVTGLQTALTTFLAAINGHTFGAINVTNQCAVSYFQGGNWAIVNNRPRYTPTRRATPHIDAVLQVQVATKLGTQRRRMAR